MTTDWPDLSALELLLAIDEQGSLGAASRELGIAQPNASRSIRRLEKQLGLTLIRRRARGSELTAQGTVIAHWASSVLSDSRHLLHAAEGLHAENESAISLCASMTAAEHLLPAWLGKLRLRHRELGVRLEVQNSATVCQRVLDGACDLGFIEAPEVPGGLHSAVVAHDELVVVVTPEHDWAGRSAPLRAADLTSTPLVVREAGSGTRTTLDAALADVGHVQPLLELGSTAAVRSAVLSRAGPAVLSTLAVAENLKNGDLTKVEVEDINLRRSLHAVWVGERVITGAAGDLLRIAHDELALLCESEGV